MLFLIYLFGNGVVFCIYWWDKQAAVNGTWRVSERTLLWLAFVGGSLGAIGAQRVLRHKTRKEPFRTILMAIVALHVVLAATLLLAPDLTGQLIGRIVEAI